MFKEFFSKNKTEKDMNDTINPMYVGSIWRNNATGEEAFVKASALRMGKPYVTFSDNQEIPENLISQMYTKLRLMNESERLKQTASTGTDEERMKAQLIAHLGNDIDFGDGAQPADLNPNLPPVANSFYGDVPSSPAQPELPAIGAPDVVRSVQQPTSQPTVQTVTPPVAVVPQEPVSPVRVLLEGMKTKKITTFKVDYEFIFPSEGLYNIMVDEYTDVDDDIVNYYLEKIDLESVRKAFSKSLYGYIEENYKK